MSDQVHDNTSDSSTTGGLSRRNALKAGVAVGVGAIAWSGPTITSLGGTPVYAAGCTFAIDVRLNIKDRNTDQSDGCRNYGGQSGTGFGYHELQTFDNMPTGFSIFNLETNQPGGWGSQVCSTAANPYDLRLSYPSNLDCVIQIQFIEPAGGGTVMHTFTAQVTAHTDDGTTETDTWHLPTGPEVSATGTYPSSTRYALFLRCVGEGDDPACFEET
jgi:hypothetical protein